MTPLSRLRTAEVAISVATTTITVEAVEDDPDRDPYDPEPAATVLYEGVRANIGSVTGREYAVGGQQSITEPRLTCDPIGLLHTHRVIDDQTGFVYEVNWVEQRTGFGLEHTTAILKRAEGLSTSGSR
jgi:hypothetical protein